MASVVVLSSVAIILVWILFRRRRTTKQRLVVVDEEQDSSSSLRTRLSPLHSDVFYNDDKSGFTTGSSHVTEGPARVSGGPRILFIPTMCCALRSVMSASVNEKIYSGGLALQTGSGYVSRLAPSAVAQL